MKNYTCHHGSNGAELDIRLTPEYPGKFMLILSAQGFEAHRHMTREDMEDMIQWIKEAINADQD